MTELTEYYIIVGDKIEGKIVWKDYLGAIEQAREFIEGDFRLEEVEDPNDSP